MPLCGQQSLIGCIGAGAVGGTLGVALEQAGYRVVAVPLWSTGVWWLRPGLGGRDHRTTSA